jgi:TolB-like protein
MNPLQAQTPAQPVSLLPNIAVTPFVGDETVTNQQLIFLTGKFAGELMATKAFQVLDRGKMDYILMEQGFQQSGACNSSECQVQMGQLLGVDFIVSGNLVRFGSKYAFRADYIDVGSGQVVQSVERSESGDLEDVYEALCKGAAITLAQSVTAQVSPSINGGPLAMQNTVPSDAIPTTTSHPLSFKRKLALAIWGTSLVGAGGGVYFNNKAKTESDHYYAAVDAKTYYPTKNAYDEANTATKYRMVSYGASLGTFVIGAVLWFLPEGK